MEETNRLLPTTQKYAWKPIIVKVCTICALIGGCGLAAFTFVDWSRPSTVLQKSTFAEPSLFTTVKEGRLLGKLIEARNNRKYFAFLGVPYAKAPIGDLRFRPPRDPEPWDGVRNATEFAGHCPMQLKEVDYPLVIGNEDCLYLNIYSPNLELTQSSTKFPVMLYIHGGGRGYGTGQLYGAEYLMEEDVIFITIDYRTGPLGTLSLHIPDASGNQGLKDQVQALKWIRLNIRSFGGNPEKVTLFGNSGGAFQVSAHTLSPLSKGLFQRVILQSGTTIFPGVLSAVPEKDAEDLAVLSNCTTYLTSAMLSCLKKLPMETLITNALKLSSKFSFTFSVDSGSHSNDTFLPDLPLQLLKNGALTSMPMMIGVTSAEGLLNSLLIFTNTDDPVLNSDAHNVSELICKELHFGLSAEDPLKVSRRVTDFYIPNGMQPVSSKLFWNVTDMFSDRQYTHPVRIVVENQLIANSKYFNKRQLLPNFSQNGVYLYYFSRPVHHSFEDKMKSMVEFDGLETAPAHGDDLQFLYPMDSRVTPISDENSVAFSRQYIKFWTHFAESGEPGKADNGNLWQPVVAGSRPYRAFEFSEHPQMIDFLPDRLKFWNNFRLEDIYR